ncbi:hypothetical protein QBC36DRAFT_189026, partial [Triangularia setosa]
PLIDDFLSRTQYQITYLTHAEQNLEMFALINILTIWLLSLSLPLTTAQGPGFKRFHDFSKTCTNITFNDWYLSADCTPFDPSKSVEKDSLDPLDLNFCVGLGPTGLTWDVYGKFSNYCKDCALNTNFGVILECECGFWDIDETQNVTLDLDTGIGNYNGSIFCYTTGPTNVPNDFTTAC